LPTAGEVPVLQAIAKVTLASPRNEIPLRILVAEDNRINQLLILKLLERMGHNVTVAENGRIAVAAVEESSFDLVLMDIHMPEMDGIEATVAIRQSKQERVRRIPIIAVTASAMPGDREMCLAGDMDGYVSKPVSIATLAQAIERCYPPGYLKAHVQTQEAGVS